MSITFRRLEPGDNRDRFASGKPDLDRFFRHRREARGADVLSSLWLQVGVGGREYPDRSPGVDADVSVPAGNSVPRQPVTLIVNECKVHD